MHFSVFVKARNEPELHELLLPYGEYGVSEELDTKLQPWLEFEADEEQNEAIHEGTKGYWHNPQAEWDWWVIGGRYCGLLTLFDLHWDWAGTRKLYADTALMSVIDMELTKAHNDRTDGRAFTHALLDEHGWINRDWQKHIDPAYDPVFWERVATWKPTDRVFVVDCHV